MKIIFLGEDSFSALVLESMIENEQEVIGVFSPTYNNLIYKRLENTAIKNSIPFQRLDNINSSYSIELIRKLEPDLIISTHFQQLLKKEIIEIPRIGCVNLHPSLLPKYRGMAPQHWPIIFGDSKTGVSVHYVNEGIDTGNIINQKILSIHPDCYVSELQSLLIPLYKEVINESLTLILSGYRGAVQSRVGSSYFGRLKAADTVIRCDMSVKQAYALIRAVSCPYMGAVFDGVRIWKAHPINKIASGEHSDSTVIGIHEIDGKHFLSLWDGFLELDKFDL
jgi:methionyl-tRNA formyltransferase